MPFKIVAEKNTKGLLDALEIEKKDIQELVETNFKHTRKNKKDYPDDDYKEKMDKDNDSRSCWFSMPEIETLLAANGYNKDATPEEKKKWGIRIYFGYHHKKNNFKPRRNNGSVYEEVFHQHTSILVVTQTRQLAGQEIEDLDHLDLNDTVSVAGTDSGLDNGKLCPPSCSGALIKL